MMQNTTVHNQQALAAYTITDIGLRPGYANSIAYGINAAGQVVVVVCNKKMLEEAHSYLWQSGQWTDLGSLGGPSTIASAINDQGDVVGRSLTGDNLIRPFLWHNGTMRNLGTFGGEPSHKERGNDAHSINKQGQVAGGTSTKDRVNHFFTLG